MGHIIPGHIWAGTLLGQNFLGHIWAGTLLGQNFLGQKYLGHIWAGTFLGHLYTIFRFFEKIENLNEINDLKIDLYKRVVTFEDDKAYK
jgi:hypothetical protein